MMSDIEKDIIISEEMLKEKIYEIRGQKVMLDFELAEIYGYTTKAFNQQVKNNIEKFDEDFMFRLTKEELDELSRSNFLTLNSRAGRGSNIKYCPYAFTEQGIYMLMTVLRGELATRQSKALIRTFKQMKDYIIENQGLIGNREYLQLSMQISGNIHETMELRADLNEVENQMADVMDRLSMVVTKSDISEIMNDFGEPQIKRGYLLLNGQPFKADVAYSEIYNQAKDSIYIIDNYIGLKTLELLIGSIPGVKNILFSDNVGNGLHKSIFDDFCKEHSDIQIQLRKTNGIFHDRYVILDYNTENEKVFLCGGSSKDAGGRVTTISEVFETKMFHSLIDTMFNNPMLELN